MTKSVARELASRNITCNAVAPGFIATAMTDKMTDDAREALAGQIPLGRLGTPEDVAAAVALPRLRRGRLRHRDRPQRQRGTLHPVSGETDLHVLDFGGEAREEYGGFPPAREGGIE